jgi:hypothetical protein
VQTPNTSASIGAVQRAVIVIATVLLAAGWAGNASAASGSSVTDAIVDYFTDWFPRVTRIQSEQPHWVTPVVTVTPRLEEEFRYDQSWQANQQGVATDNFGSGKGLELIPFQNTEVILGVPNWVAYNGAIKHGKSAKTDGWADETFLVKYRILSANEEHGNYILTALMGFREVVPVV